MDSSSDLTYSCLGIDHLDEVWEYCKSVEAKWHTLAEYLNVHGPTVDQIRSNEKDVSNCLRDVLSAWLRSSFPTQPKPSWRSLCDALAGMGEVAFSERIHKEHPCRCDLCNSATVTRHTSVSMTVQQENATDAAKKLKKSFNDLMAGFLVKRVAEINIHKLRYQISSFFAENGISNEINKQAINIEDCSTPNAILNHFRRHRFIGYINYSLIKVFQKLAKVPLLDRRIKEYEKNYQCFLELSLAQPICMIFQQCPDLRSDYPTGIPKVMIYLESEWNGQSIFELKDLLKQCSKKDSEGAGIDRLVISRICMPFGGSSFSLIEKEHRSMTGQEAMTNPTKTRVRLSKSESDEQSPQDHGFHFRKLSWDHTVATDQTSGRSSDIIDTEGDADSSVTSLVSDVGGDYENGDQRVESKELKLSDDSQCDKCNIAIPTNNFATPFMPNRDSSKEHLKHQEEGDCSTFNLFYSCNVTNSSMQFDYWVPIEDLLYGATVVDSRVFNVHGDHEQTYPWPECGFSLYIPAGSLDRIETCPVAVKALISGQFKFPKGFQLISALYAISPGRKFRKKIKMSIQHCFLIEREKQLKQLCFIKACGTANPSDPYVFEYVDGGTFTLGNQYCDLWQNEFSIYGAGEVTGEDGPDPEGGGSDQQQSNKLEEVNDDSNHCDDKESPVPNVNGSYEDHGEPGGTTSNDISLKNNDPVVVNAGSENKARDSKATADPKMYRTHFFCARTKEHPNSWAYKIAVIKHLAVHIEYIKTQFTEGEQVESFTFHFLEHSNPSIEFIFSSEAPKGWHVDPITAPCCISMEEVNALSTQELKVQAHERQFAVLDIPMREVVVFAGSNCVEDYIKYGIVIKGISPKKMFHIIRFLGGAGVGVVNTAAGGQPFPIPNSVTSNLSVHQDKYGGITDLRKLKSILNRELDRECADLESLLEANIDPFASQLFQNGMITPGVKSNPSFNAIMREVKAKPCRSAEVIVKHYKKFLEIVAMFGEPLKDLASLIADSMSKAVSDEFENANINFV